MLCGGRTKTRPTGAVWYKQLVIAATMQVSLGLNRRLTPNTSQETDQPLRIRIVQRTFQHNRSLAWMANCYIMRTLLNVTSASTPCSSPAVAGAAGIAAAAL
jgi:hypothetical protein